MHYLFIFYYWQQCDATIILESIIYYSAYVLNYIHYVFSKLRYLNFFRRYWQEATADLIFISISSFGEHFYLRDGELYLGCQLKSHTCHRATVEPLSKAFNPHLFRSIFVLDFISLWIKVPDKCIHANHPCSGSPAMWKIYNHLIPQNHP